MKRGDSNFKKHVLVGITSLAVLVNTASFGLDLDGSTTTEDGVYLPFGSPQWQTKMREDGLVALYLFNETSGTVKDVSGYLNQDGVAEPLDLVIEDPIAGVDEVLRKNGSIEIKFPTLIRSQGPAAKIHRECSASNELTIEAWIKNADTAELPRINPIRILTYSNKISPLRNDRPESQQLSSFNTNFVLGQEYEDTSRYRGIIRTTQRSQGASIGIGPNITLVNSLQHVVVTRDSSGVGRFFVSYKLDDGTVIDTLRTEIGNDQALRGSFNNWDSKAVLGLANEISYRDPAARPEDDSRNTTEDRAWLGEMFLVGIYCKAMTPRRISGDAAPGLASYQSFKINPNIIITENHKKAVLLYKRLAGVSTSIANPIIDSMASEIAKGDKASWLRAAAIATEEKDFYNVTVKDFAARMSTRDETVNAPLSDFVATVIGVTRDEISAKQLLTGNFSYQGDPKKAAVVSNTLEDLIKSNNHYEALETGRFDLKKVLVKSSPQYISNAQGGIVANPNPAGVLTSRAFMSAHAIAGTNRRLVEFAFREFLCAPIEKWADSYGPDNYVGRDVERFPGGDHNTYRTTCRACHTGMDALRGAFARYTFSDDIIKNAFIFGASDNESETTMKQMPRGIASKMNHNEDKFPDGRVITDDFFENVAVRGANAEYFNWQGPMTGYGIKEFGEMVSNAGAFPKCMAKRVYRSVCKREPASFDLPMLDRVASEFVSDNFNLKKLFERVAITPECIGQ